VSTIAPPEYSGKAGMPRSRRGREHLERANLPHHPLGRVCHIGAKRNDTSLEHFDQYSAEAEHHHAVQNALAAGPRITFHPLGSHLLSTAAFDLRTGMCFSTLERIFLYAARASSAPVHVEDHSARIVLVNHGRPTSPHHHRRTHNDSASGPHRRRPWHGALQQRHAVTRQQRATVGLGDGNPLGVIGSARSATIFIRPSNVEVVEHRQLRRGISCKATNQLAAARLFTAVLGKAFGNARRTQNLPPPGATSFAPMNEQTTGLVDALDGLGHDGGRLFDVVSSTRRR